MDQWTFKISYSKTIKFQAISVALYVRSEKEQLFQLSFQMQLAVKTQFRSNYHKFTASLCYANKYNMLQKIVSCWLWNLCIVWGRKTASNLNSLRTSFCVLHCLEVGQVFIKFSLETWFRFRREGNFHDQQSSVGDLHDYDPWLLSKPQTFVKL